MLVSLKTGLNKNTFSILRTLFTKKIECCKFRIHRFLYRITSNKRPGRFAIFLGFMYIRGQIICKWTQNNRTKIEKKSYFLINNLNIFIFKIYIIILIQFQAFLKVQADLLADVLLHFLPSLKHEITG